MQPKLAKETGPEECEDYRLGLVEGELAGAGGADSVGRGFFAFVLYKVLEARLRTPYVVGGVGTLAEAIDDMETGSRGFVLLEGETWRARSLSPVRRGERVRVVAKEGPVLVVEPYEAPHGGHQSP